MTALRLVWCLIQVRYEESYWEQVAINERWLRFLTAPDETTRKQP